MGTATDVHSVRLVATSRSMALPARRRGRLIRAGQNPGQICSKLTYPINSTNSQSQIFPTDPAHTTTHLHPTNNLSAVRVCGRRAVAEGCWCSRAKGRDPPGQGSCSVLTVNNTRWPLGRADPTGLGKIRLILSILSYLIYRACRMSSLPSPNTTTTGAAARTCARSRIKASCVRCRRVS